MRFRSFGFVKGINAVDYRTDAAVGDSRQDVGNEAAHGFSALFRIAQLAG